MPTPPLRIFRGICPKCGCEIECNHQEATFTAERHPGGKAEWSIKCPFSVLSFKCDGTIPLKEVIYRGDDGKTILKAPTLSEEFEKFFCDDNEPCEDQSKPPPPPVKKKPYMIVSDGPSVWPPSRTARELLARLQKRNELSRLIDEILEG